MIRQTRAGCSRATTIKNVRPCLPITDLHGVHSRFCGEIPVSNKKKQVDILAQFVGPLERGWCFRHGSTQEEQGNWREEGSAGDLASRWSFSCAPLLHRRGKNRPKSRFLPGVTAAGPGWRYPTPGTGRKRSRTLRSPWKPSERWRPSAKRETGCSPPLQSARGRDARGEQMWGQSA